ncbi:hypothetical protein TNCV_2941201 [Trichonephila clavipes]|nr:hypothetical protein TNCV_2941201 [Trichonephila clavipes]
MSTMDVDPPDAESQSPCYQRLKLKGRIATEKMLLKTFHDLKSTFHTSNPSLMETTNAAATEHQVIGCLGFRGGLCLPNKTARPASPSNSEPVATANSFTNLVEDQNQDIEDKEAKLAEVPNPRPLQPIHLKITENF